MELASKVIRPVAWCRFCNSGARNRIVRDI